MDIYIVCLNLTGPRGKYLERMKFPMLQISNFRVSYRVKYDGEWCLVDLQIT